jgi:predicted nuclease of predicted toxin-antitoxin system
MKYLIDNQLPPALAGHLQTQGLVASHVADFGLEQATDREIWQYAGANGFAIVSKDEDFLHLSATDPSGPPFVWVRLGNCRKAALLAAFDRVLPQLVQAIDAGDKVVEVR